ncbi:unnamed protein product [Chrysodeixis includens]|uniref:C3H1-type domain-containing protein n=1 Tax=Chrysodeixis includens TaxID=689277 RepID=A0A9P0BIW5_CHRIL|nr:unnamed protein product [Chrysodeixis includens]
MGSNSEQNGCQQNGCQPSVSQPVASTSDPLIQSASSSDQQVKVCRDYIWGICTKGTQCKFRHEFDVAMMKNVLKFCHDHQNRTGCSRPGCSYLHTTKEEENLFLTTGQIPRALAERHSAMFAAPANLYANEFVGGQAPPLPPQPQLETTAVAAATSTTGGPPPPHSFKDPKPPLPPPPASLRGLPVPPPPPPPLPLTLPPPSTRAPVPALIPPPEFIAPLPSMYGAVEPPPPLPMFDTSRPPPSLASVTLKSQTSIVIKRAAESSEAGPSKARKLENSNVERLCESCVQRELRIKFFRREQQRLECEREYHAYILKTKSEGYENGRLLLKSVLSPESFRILDEYIEGTSQHFNHSSALSETSTVPRQFLHQLLDCVANNSRNHPNPPPPPSVRVDQLSLLQSLSVLTRRSEPVNDVPADVLQALLGALRNSSSLNNFRTPSTESRSSGSLGDGRGASNSTALSSGAAVNGLNHFLNGGAGSSSRTFTATQAAPPAAPPVAAPPAPAPMPPAAPPTPAPPPPPPAAQPATQPAAPAPAGPASYLPYQPPPARPYYPQYPAGFNHLPNAAYSSPARAAAAPLAPQRAPAPAQPPAPPQQNYNVYGAARYPSQPHYYPPFQ